MYGLVSSQCHPNPSVHARKISWLSPIVTRCWKTAIKARRKESSRELALSYCAAARDLELTPSTPQTLWNLIYLFSREGKQSGEIPVLFGRIAMN